MDFTVTANHNIKTKESEKKDKYLDLTRELKKRTIEYEGDGDANCNRYTCNNPLITYKGTRRLRNQRTSRDHPNCSIFEISQNTEKSP